MAISSEQLWPHIRDAFGISKKLGVTEMTMRMAVNSAVEITLTSHPDFDSSAGRFNEIKTKFNLGDPIAPKVDPNDSYWAGVKDGLDVRNDPIWMHTAHLIAYEAKCELQQMATKFIKEHC